MTTPVPVSHTVARIQAWLSSNKATRAQIAREAAVDEKTVRLAVRADWNPRVKTLAKLEALIPPDWDRRESRRRKAS